MAAIDDGWIDALSEAAGDFEVDPSIDLTIEYQVGALVYRLAISEGNVEVSSGTGDHDVRFVTGPQVAAEIHTGERPALDAFMHGDMTVGGDLTRLIAGQPAFAALGELFAAARSAMA